MCSVPVAEMNTSFDTSHVGAFSLLHSQLFFLSHFLEKNGKIIEHLIILSPSFFYIYI